MIRIHVVCEGQTEEMFINEVLSKEFLTHQIYLYPSLIGKPGHKGGHVNFDRLKNDIKSILLTDSKSYCTTFFDFYGLANDFPGKAEAENIKAIKDKQQIMNQRLIEKLKLDLNEVALNRFIPYVQMHEFEGLLFSSPASIALEIGEKDLMENFEKIRSAFETPEHINDSPMTAPSKRIKNLFPQYDKIIHGSLIAMDIGIDKICVECPLFNEWILCLKSLNVIV